ATGGSATAATAVRMTLFDSTGHAVFTTVALAGQPLATGAVWLAAGNYTVVFNAATRDGSALGSLAVDVAARALSDPIDAYAADDAIQTFRAPKQAPVRGANQAACLVHIYPTRPNMGTRYPLGDDPMFIGRQDDCAIQNTDGSVSRYHAKIALGDNGGYVIAD